MNYESLIRGLLQMIYRAAKYEHPTTYASMVTEFILCFALLIS